MKRVRRVRRIQKRDSVFPFLTTNEEIVEPPPRPRPAVTRKSLLLADLKAARSAILDAAGTVPPDRQEEIWLGDWSIRDLLAHLIGWDLALLAAAQDILIGELPSFYHLRDEDWRTINGQFVQQYNKGDYSELLNAVKESHNQLLAYLKSIPEAEFLDSHGVTYEGSPVTIGRLIAAETRDEEEHYEQLADWLGIQEEEDADQRG